VPGWAGDGFFRIFGMPFQGHCPGRGKMNLPLGRGSPGDGSLAAEGIPYPPKKSLKSVTGAGSSPQVSLYPTLTPRPTGRF